MVKILDKYVFTESLKYFTLSILTFLTLFAVIDMVSNLEILIKYGLKTEVTYVTGRFPLYLVRVIPIAVLLSAMITLSKFSSTSELTVVKALGISIYRFTLPLVLLASLASLTSLLLQEKVVPAGLSKVKEVEALMEKRKGEKVPINGIWVKNEKNQYIFFWSFKPAEKEGERITVLSVNGTKPVKRVDALKAKYRGNGIWRLKEGFERDFEELKSQKFKEKDLNLQITPKELLLSSTLPESMGLTQLFLTIKRLSRIGYETDYLSLELYSRLSLSLLPIVAVIIGIPFGVYNPRNKRGYTLLFAALLIVSMWIVISLFLSLGKSGVLPPSYAAFAPLFIFGAVGLTLLGRVDT